MWILLSFMIVKMITLIIIQTNQMISYQNPLCSATGLKATHFCTVFSCDLPAFGCSAECLLSSGHKHSDRYPNGEIIAWGAIQKSISMMMDLSLSNDEFDNLKRQEKQLRIIQDQLRIIQQIHSNALVQSKRKLKCFYGVDKVLQKIRNKTKNAIKGKDMGVLIQMMQQNQIFANNLRVNRAIQQRFSSMDETIKIFQRIIDLHKQRTGRLVQPEHILLEDFIKITPTINIQNSKTVSVGKDNIFTIKDIRTGYHPVFGKEELLDGQIFQVQVMQNGEHSECGIGVATIDLKNGIDKHRTNNSICYCTWDQFVSKSTGQVTPFYTFDPGEIFTVRRNKQNIEWAITPCGISCSAPIPQRLSKVPLYPVCWFKNSGKKNALLKFL